LAAAETDRARERVGQGEGEARLLVIRRAAMLGRDCCTGRWKGEAPGANCVIMDLREGTCDQTSFQGFVGC
jgi:hypothetical protein